MSIIADFPGIDALLEAADAVVVARIGPHIPSRGIRINDWSEFYTCYIQQTLKGDLRPSSYSPVVLRLEDVTAEFTLLLRENTVAILFLRKHGKDQHGGEYSSLKVTGSTIEIAPFGSETVSQSGAPKARIKAMIQHYRQYRAKRIRGEEELLQRVLRS